MDSDLVQLINKLSSDLTNSLRTNLTIFVEKNKANNELLQNLKIVLFKMPEYVELNSKYNKLVEDYDELTKKYNLLKSKFFTGKILNTGHIWNMSKEHRINKLRKKLFLINPRARINKFVKLTEFYN